MGEKQPIEDTRQTHGMCSDCHSRVMRQLEGISFADLLDDFDKPVAIINEEGRIAAANNKALQMLGKPLEEVQGFLGGEAMECAYARLPEGCGNTIHCSACTVRNLVEDTQRTKKSSTKTRVFLKTDEGELEILLSTSYVDEMVRIVFEEITLVSPSGNA
ncbi:PAS domain-containing protein [Desulfopila sp. IMCC35008]|uniref:PAS domain-containing protein n=1 Tax=Desulfopila sp. IMCC35008 TaxID=2653858 RepID=UPI0013D1D99C|nr:PAS domain-containing protein [Desulfopila sp. IMCC35008]